MKFKRLAISASAILVGLAAALYISLISPRVLFFPYHRAMAGTEVYSETAIPDAALPVLEEAQTRLKLSAIYDATAPFGAIYLTNGGWRWRLLALQNTRAFALTRPLGENVVVNRSDVTQNKIWSGASVAGERVLSDVIAHERTHTLIRKHFGANADRRYPVWVREGYCDYVAGSSSLSDAQFAKLQAQGSTLPAMRYYEGRQHVSAALHRNGGSVDALFRSAVGQ